MASARFEGERYVYAPSTNKLSLKAMSTAQQLQHNSTLTDDGSPFTGSAKPPWMIRLVSIRTAVCPMRPQGEGPVVSWLRQAMDERSRQCRPSKYLG